VHASQPDRAHPRGGEKIFSPDPTPVLKPVPVVLREHGGDGRREWGGVKGEEGSCYPFPLAH